MSIVAYISVITLMVVLAIGNLGHVYEQTNGSWETIAQVYPGVLWRVLSAEMFYFSDICVARERFVASSPLNQWIGLPLYFGAQVLIAFFFESSSQLEGGSYLPEYLRGLQ